MKPNTSLKLPGKVALVLIAGVAGYLCRRADLGFEPAVVFYVSLIVLMASLWMLVPNVLLTKVPGLATVGRSLIMLVVLLPAADYAFLKLQSKVIASTKPFYSFRAAKGNPAAYAAWWAYYAEEWRRPNGFQASTEMPDPKGILPFVTIPNSTGKFFESVIRFNNFGFRGNDINRNKGDRFRIFALGESPTFGPTIHRDDRPWPEVLQALVNSRLACVRNIEVINAGTEFYDLNDNLERVRRDIIPLEPDLVISYHGLNGFRAGFIDNPSTAKLSPVIYLLEPQQQRKRPSALIEAAREKLYIWKKERTLVSTYSEDKIMHRQYAELYRELIRLGHENHFQVVLANSSLAVNASSPQDVREFYGIVSRGINIWIAQNAAHNEMVKKIANAAGVPFIDTTPNLDGNWDADLYLDLAHFTQKGNDLIAQHIFDGLVPVLQRDETLRCVER
jgi:lysophospholipase L1-like esterase